MEGQSTLLRLKLREENRKEALEEKRAAQRAICGDETASAFFASLSNFAAEVKRDVAATSKGVSTRAVFDELVERIREFSRKLTVATRYLAAYDVQRAQQTLGELEQLVRGRKARILPREEFTFQRARLKQGMAIVQPSEVAVVPEARGEAEAVVRPTLVGETLFVGGAGTALVSDARMCTIEVAEGMSQLKCVRLEGCTVKCGALNGSLFVESCVNCTFEIAALWQLRIHNSSHCRFSIIIRSEPILEDCTAIVFSPFGGITDASNLWNCAKDFNCVAGVSPNYTNEG